MINHCLVALEIVTFVQIVTCLVYSVNNPLTFHYVSNASNHEPFSEKLRLMSEILKISVHENIDLDS